MITMTFDDKK